MPYFVATYAYTADETSRTETRPEHRAWLATLSELVVSGPTDAEGAVLILEADSAEAARALLDADPFTVHGGIIGERTVVGWTPVSGRLATAF